MTNRDPLIETAFPELSKKSRHELEYSNTEYLYDIYGATNYTLTGVQVNPGLMESFPVLSGMATQFETYRFTKLEFFYKPFVASVLASSNVQLGFIGMGFCYDPSEKTHVANGDTSNTAFPSKASFLNYQGSISAKPSVPLKFSVDCSRMKTNLLYVRQGEFSNIDIRMSDLGTFIWACGDQQSTGLMGELYVKYTVKFLKSKPNYSLGNSNKYSHYRLSGNISSSNLFGDIQTPQSGSNVKLSFYKTGTAISPKFNFTLPPYPALCNYMVYIQYKGDSVAWTLPQPVVNGDYLLNNGSSYYSSLTGTSTIANLSFFLITISNLGVAGSSNEDTTVQFNYSVGITLPPNITSADLFIIQIPANAIS
jgi:hypothetical protein